MPKYAEIMHSFRSNEACLKFLLSTEEDKLGIQRLRSAIQGAYCCFIHEIKMKFFEVFRFEV
ncbi:hypothetical protein SCA6_008901 [Theobroma cacao]